MKGEIIDKFTLLITSAFGFVAALAWNEAVKGFLIDFGLQRFGPWIYAVVVTILAVVVTIVLSRFSRRIKEIELRYERYLKKIRKKKKR